MRLMQNFGLKISETGTSELFFCCGGKSAGVFLISVVQFWRLGNYPNEPLFSGDKAARICRSPLGFIYVTLTFKIPFTHPTLLINKQINK
jgi:hypothetical protein